MAFFEKMLVPMIIMSVLSSLGNAGYSGVTHTKWFVQIIDAG